MLRDQGQLPPVKRGWWELRFNYELETDDTGHQLTFLHLWRKGFLGRYTEEVRLRLQGSEIIILSLHLKSRALLKALFLFRQVYGERPYTVSLISWTSRLNQVIASRYPQYDDW
jgi:hypothetical protein